MMLSLLFCGLLLIDIFILRIVKCIKYPLCYLIILFQEIELIFVLDVLLCVYFMCCAGRLNLMSKVCVHHVSVISGK